MSELTFLMGQFAATFPTDRCYARNQVWPQSSERSTKVILNSYLATTEIVDRHSSQAFRAWINRSAREAFASFGR